MYDAIIIGSGPGGIDCAMEIKRLGGKVVVVEKSELGGTCLNLGCIPTKTLRNSADMILKLKEIHKIGVSVDNISLDFTKIVKRKENVIKALKLGIKMQFDSYDIETIKGEGEIIDSKTVKVDKKNYKTKNIVIATGSKPSKVFEGEKVLTSDEILKLENVPKKLVIIGGGVVGLEYAMIFKAFGSDVTIIEALDRCISKADASICEEIKTVLKKNGIKTLTSTGARYENDTLFAGEKVIEFDALLSATGREAVFPKGMNELNVHHDKIIEVNEKMQTNVQNVYAIGDTSSKVWLAHNASYQGKIAARNIMKKEALNHQEVSQCIYTMPEIAWVGKREQDIKGKAIIKEFRFAGNSYARCNDKLHGFIKIVADKKTEVILGVHIIGECASEIIVVGQMAVNKGMTIQELRNVIYPHPTYIEIYKQALET